MKCVIIKNSNRGKDVKNLPTPCKVTNPTPNFFLTPQSAHRWSNSSIGGPHFQKGNSMRIKRKKTVKKVKQKPLPIVIVPDKTYIDDKGLVIPTDIILISDPIMYKRMSKVLAAWGKEIMGVPGKRGDVDG